MIAIYIPSEPGWHRLAGIGNVWIIRWLLNCTIYKVRVDSQFSHRGNAKMVPRTWNVLIEFRWYICSRSKRIMYHVHIFSFPLKIPTSHLIKHCHLRSDTSSSSSSPSSKISCPLPSLTNPATTAPKQASIAIPHQANPTIPIFNPRPYIHPANAGPSVLVPLLTL